MNFIKCHGKFTGRVFQATADTITNAFIQRFSCLLLFSMSTTVFPETTIINDLVVAVSMPSYPYPFEEKEPDIREKMATMKSFINQSTRGSINFNFDLDQDGKDDLFHVSLSKDIDPCANRPLVIGQAVRLALMQKPGIKFNHKTILILGESCAQSGGWGAMAIGSETIIAKGTGGSYPHEFGHNIGFPHTNTDIDNTDKGVGYGMQDPMEAGGVVFYHAPHVWGKKWFGDCPACFQDWDVNKKNATISPLGTPSPLLPAAGTPPVLIARIADDDQPGKYYFLSYRAPVVGTYEENLRPEAQTGLSIHHSSGRFRMASLIHVMQDKETYLIPNTKITITQHSHDIEGVKISTTLGYRCASKRHRNPSRMAWGDGSLSAPYAICTAEQFTLLSQRPKLLTKAFTLAADVDLSAVPFSSIGSLDKPFTGKFFGNLKTITAHTQQPLFGAVSGAEIRDFSLNGAALDPSGEAPSGIVTQVALDSEFSNISVNEFTMTAKNNLGAIAGTAERSILSHILVNGTITYNSNIENVGGLIGNGSELVIEQSKVKLILRTLTLNTITNVGSLAGQLSKSSVLNSYALSNYYLWPSHRNVDAVGSLIGRAANVLLKQVYFSGDVNAHPSSNPSSLVGYVADDPNAEPNTVQAAVGALLAIKGGRDTLVGEKVSLGDMYSADFLLAKGFSAENWLLGNQVLPKLKYEYDPDGLPDEVDD